MADDSTETVTWRGRDYEAAVYFWKDQKRYRCPTCRRDDKDPQRMAEHIATTHFWLERCGAKDIELPIRHRDGEDIFGCPYCSFEHPKPGVVARHCARTRTAPEEAAPITHHGAAAEPGFPEAKQAGASDPSGPMVTNGADGGGSNWQAIEISFLSDHRVQIRNGTKAYSHNYAELGFADRRTRQGEPKPNQAWVTFRAMAEQKGIIRDGAKTNAVWRKVEKRVQEIRRNLKAHFGISGDPVPYVAGTGYQAVFRIGCSPSFHT